MADETLISAPRHAVADRRCQAVGVERHFDVDGADQLLVLVEQRDAGGAEIIAEHVEGVVGQRIDVGDFRVADDDLVERHVGLDRPRLALGNLDRRVLGRGDVDHVAAIGRRRDAASRPPAAIEAASSDMAATPRPVRPVFPIPANIVIHPQPGVPPVSVQFCAVCSCRLPGRSGVTTTWYDCGCIPRVTMTVVNFGPSGSAVTASTRAPAVSTTLPKPIRQRPKSSSPRRSPALTSFDERERQRQRADIAGERDFLGTVDGHLEGHRIGDLRAGLAFVRALPNRQHLGVFDDDSVVIVEPAAPAAFPDTSSISPASRVSTTSTRSPGRHETARRPRSRRS